MYRVLSLDGGGIRGLITAVILQRLAAARPGFLASVDLIAGTSTGGIIALALAAGLTPTDIVNLYYQNGCDIFDASWIHEVESFAGARAAKYDNAKLRTILQGKFGTKTLGQLPVKVVIPTFDLCAATADGRCWAPRMQHNFGGADDSGVALVDAALRTSAAPTYFPSVGSFIDGGVGANDPAAEALAHAVGLGSADPRQVFLLSLGTGRALQSIPGADHDWGDVEWGVSAEGVTAPLINLLLDANVGIAEGQCSMHLGARYCRLSPVLPQPPIPLDAWKRRDDLVKIGQSADLTGALAWLDAAWCAAPAAA